MEIFSFLLYHRSTYSPPYLLILKSLLGGLLDAMLGNNFRRSMAFRIIFYRFVI